MARYVALRGRNQRSSLFYNTIARHERHESDTSTTRVRHERHECKTRLQHECDTSATRMTQVEH